MQPEPGTRRAGAVSSSAARRRDPTTTRARGKSSRRSCGARIAVPSTDEDIETLLPIYRAARTAGSFDAGIQRIVERVLVSPEFLLRIEYPPAHIAQGAAHRISDVELASRLSFFLWSSIPDDELLDLAAAGQAPGVQRARAAGAADARRRARRRAGQQLRRAVAVPARSAGQKAERSVVSGFRRRPAAGAAPRDGAVLRQHRSRGPERPRPADRRTTRSSTSGWRSTTASRTSTASHFRRVTLGDDSARRGLLGQGSILTLTSYAHADLAGACAASGSSRTSSARRRRRHRRMCRRSRRPPTEGKVLSMRERMAQHRANPVCASCHARMDPLGSGARELRCGRAAGAPDGESGAPIDASGVLPDGTTLRWRRRASPGPARRDPSGSSTTLTEKLLTYARRPRARLRTTRPPSARLCATRPATSTASRRSSLGIVKSHAVSDAGDRRVMIITKDGAAAADVSAWRRRHARVAAAGCDGTGAVRPRRDRRQAGAPHGLHLQPERRHPAICGRRRARAETSSCRRF